MKLSIGKYYLVGNTKAQLESVTIESNCFYVDGIPKAVINNVCLMVTDDNFKKEVYDYELKELNEVEEWTNA